MAKRERTCFLLLTIVLGSSIRLSPLFFRWVLGVLNLPFGNGGLYILFAREIMRHHYALPVTIPYYTINGVPYAYPPLAFYIVAILLDLTSVAEFTLSSFLPAIFSCVTVVVFYRMAIEFTQDERTAAFATLIYASLPAAFVEHLPGEGLVEALGTITFIVAVIWLLRASWSNDRRYLLLAGAGIGLNVLTSPGAAYGIVISAVVLWLIGHFRQARLWSGRLIAALAWGGLVSAPYWLTVAIRHTSAIFLRTFFNQHLNILTDLVFKASIAISEEPFLAVWGTLALLGFLWCLASRRHLLPIWTLSIYAIPREFPYLLAVPLALLAAYGLLEVVVPAFRRLEREHRVSKRIADLVILILLVYGLWSALNVSFRLVISETYVTREELETMQWIRANTPQEATFLVLGDELEWFPAVTERTTLNVPEGSEWAETDTVYRLEGDLSMCRLPSCWLETTHQYGLFPQYIYISKIPDTACVIEAARREPTLAVEYENVGSILFRVETAWSGSPCPE